MYTLFLAMVLAPDFEPSKGNDYAQLMSYLALYKIFMQINI